MLRTLALLLLLANALLLAAQLGVLDPLTGGGDAAHQREPERLQHQVHPEWVRILPPEAASAALRDAAASAAAARAGICLEAGPFDAADAAVAERTLRDAGIGANAWQTIRSENEGVYLIYMGRYADRDTLQRKLSEVKRLRLEVEELRGAASLQPGLSLGRFDNKAAADAALARMVQRGLHTARVVTLRAAQSQTLLRVPAADATLRARLAGLRLPSGPGFVECPVEAPPAAAAGASASPAAAASAASTTASAAPTAPAPASSVAAPRPAAAASR